MVKGERPYNLARFEVTTLAGDKDEFTVEDGNNFVADSDMVTESDKVRNEDDIKEIRMLQNEGYDFIRLYQLDNLTLFKFEDDIKIDFLHISLVAECDIMNVPSELKGIYCGPYAEIEHFQKLLEEGVSITQVTDV